MTFAMLSFAHLLRCLLLAVVVVAPSTLVPVASRADGAPLTFGFLPYLASSELIARYGPLADYLSEATGRDVRIVVGVDYAAHMDATINDEIDIAFLGALPYVQLVEAVGRRPLLARFAFNGEPSFRGAIFTAESSPVAALEDLRDRRIGFGDPRSTLSAILPKYTLRKAGVTFEAVSMQTHDNIVLGVLLDELDAGATAEEVFEENRSRGLRIVAYTPRISTHVLVASPRLGDATIARLRSALLTLVTDPRGPDVLGAIGPTFNGFVAVRDSDYDDLRAVVADLSKQVDGPPE